MKILLSENTPLFDSMVKQLNAYQDLHNMIEEILYQGKLAPYSPHMESISLGLMFGFLKGEKGYIVVAKRVFEMGLLNMFIAEEAAGSDAFQYGQRDRNQFTRNSRLKIVDYLGEQLL